MTDFPGNTWQEKLSPGHSYGAYEQLAVARILQARSAPRTLDEYVAEETTKRLEQRWGRTETQPRDLDEYDRLPVLSASACKESSWHEEPSPPIPSPSPIPPTPMTPPSASDDSSTCSD